MKCVMLSLNLIWVWSGIPLSRGDTFEYECDILQKLDELKEEIADLKSKVNEQAHLLVGLANKVSELEDLNYTSTGQLEGQAVGFTRTAPTTSTTPGQITFSTTVSNVGGGYDVTSGMFTSSIPGYYYFSASLVKVYNYVGPAYCWFRKNNEYLVHASARPGDTPQSGAFTASNSMYVHMDAGDNVTLAKCSNIASFTERSSFSGFLVSMRWDYTN